MKMHGCGPSGRAIWPMAAMMFGGRHGRGSGLGSGRGGDFEGGWGGRRGPRGRVFAAGELRLALLHLLGEQPRHGYDLIKAIEDLTGGAYAPSPGVVYPTLNLLTDEGMIIEQVGEGTRKAYGLTAAGAAELAAQASAAEALVARLKALGEADNRHRAPPVARALGNLMTALRNRAAQGEFDRTVMHDVAAILDDAAQRIERL